MFVLEFSFQGLIYSMAASPLNPLLVLNVSNTCPKIPMC